MNGGTLIRVLPKTLFDFAHVTPNTTEKIVIARALNVIPYSAAYLWVRVFKLHLGTTSTIDVVGTPALPTEDTQDSFLGSGITLSITGTAPFLTNTSLIPTGPLPPYLQITIEAFQPATPTYVGVELSIDVLARCCG